MLDEMSLPCCSPRSPGQISSQPKVWNWWGLVTYYTMFVIDQDSRRVQVLGTR
jgi:hypothetical protein